jgi:hypothetical protein
MLLGCREIIEASYIRKGSLAKRMEGHHIMARNGWRAVVNISALMVSATRFWPRPIAVATFSGAEPPWHRILGTTNLPYSCNRTRTLVERSKTSKKKRKKRRRSLYRNKISTAVKRLRGLCHLCATRFWIRPIPKTGPSLRPPSLEEAEKEVHFSAIDNIRTSYSWYPSRLEESRHTGFYSIPRSSRANAHSLFPKSETPCTYRGLVYPTVAQPPRHAGL